MIARELYQSLELEGLVEGGWGILSPWERAAWERVAQKMSDCRGDAFGEAATMALTRRIEGEPCVISWGPEEHDACLAIRGADAAGRPAIVKLREASMERDQRTYPSSTEALRELADRIRDGSLVEATGTNALLERVKLAAAEREYDEIFVRMIGADEWEAYLARRTAIPATRKSVGRSGAQREAWLVVSEVGDGTTATDALMALLVLLQ